MRKVRPVLGRRSVSIALAAVVAVTASACGGGSSTGGGTPSDDSKEVGITVLTKDPTNPYFLSIQEGAKAQAATERNVRLSLTTGRADGDEQSQVNEIEQSIARGDQGLLISPSGSGVDAAIKRAKDAGMVVMAVDTPLDPVDLGEATFGTDNFQAGLLIGRWAAARLNGQKATIAMLSAFSDKFLSVDVDRYEGFLQGMGIALGDRNRKGDEAASGRYAGGKGGDYEIICTEPTQSAVDTGKTAMERCLTKNPAVNLVYAVNERAAEGAAQALKAANNSATLVTVDGGCQGVGLVRSGTFGATSQQYPAKMGALGVQALVRAVRGGPKPQPTPGLKIFNTGVALVTDVAVPGLESIDSVKAARLCWGRNGY